MNNVNIYQFYEDNYVSLQDYAKLQSNWNSLREWLEKDKSKDLKSKQVLDKMNELEGENNGHKSKDV